MVKTDDGITVPTDRLLDAIDEQTLIVPVSHVIFRSSYINDAKAIIDKAHKVGAHVVLDTFQSLGTVPVDIQALQRRLRLQEAFSNGSAAGPALPSARPPRSRQEIRAQIHWMVRPRKFLRILEPGPTRYADPPYRFMNGTSHIPAIEAAKTGPENHPGSWHR